MRVLTQWALLMGGDLVRKGKGLKIVLRRSIRGKNSWI